MTLKELSNRFLVLDAMREKLSRVAAQRRGRDFESLVLDLFDVHGMLVRRPYHTSDKRSEQIDGAIRVGGRYALVECKWVSGQLPSSDLFAFSGKVEGKFEGTIGVFVSRNELSENFMIALRRGRRQAVLVIHGRDIDEIFKESFPLEEYLKASLEVTSVDNVSHYPATDFLATRPSAPSVVTTANKGIPSDVEAELHDATFCNIADEVAREIPRHEVDGLYEAIILKLKDVAAPISKKELQYAENLALLARELKSGISQKRLDADWTLFNNVSRNYLSSPLRSLLRIFTSRISLLSEIEREKLSQRLVRQWEKIVGKFEDENGMAEVTEPLWNFLSQDAKFKLLSFFVEFVISSRIPRYPQVRFAQKCLRGSEREDVELVVKGLLQKDLDDDLKDEEPSNFTEQQRSRTITWLIRKYEKVEDFAAVDVESLVDSLVHQRIPRVRSVRRKRK